MAGPDSREKTQVADLSLSSFTSVSELIKK
jgi:hypothetical protein